MNVEKDFRTVSRSIGSFLMDPLSAFRFSERNEDGSSDSGASTQSEEGLEDGAGADETPSESDGSATIRQTLPNGKKNWIKEWAVTLGLIASGVYIGNSFRDGDEVLEAAPEPDRVAAVVPADAELIERFGETGDLLKEGYQFIENGVINYRFPLKEKPGESIAVTGLLPGEHADEFFTDLVKNEVVIKSGDDWLFTQRVEAQKELVEAQGKANQYRNLRVFGAVGLILGLGLIVANRVKRKIEEGMSLSSLPGMSGKGDVMVERPSEGFDHVGGIEQVLGEFEFLKEEIERKTTGDPEITLPKGVLIFGDPGVGKTMLARALAAETNCPFVSFKGSELTTQFFAGSGVARVRAGFEQARQKRDEHTKELREAGNEDAEGVCIVFIDEFDSLAKKRGFGFGRGSDEDDKVVNAFLAEMDNVDKKRNRNIIVIAATNDLNALDSAAIRPGRFDRRIEVPKPVSKESRLDVLSKAFTYKIEPKGYSIDRPDTLERLARVTKGCSAADLVGALEKGLLLARRDSRKKIHFDDLIEGHLQQSVGYKSSFHVPEHEREKTAQHEVVGHGAVAWALGIASMLVTTEPRGKALGMVIPDPNALSELCPTRQQLLEQIVLCLGGTVSEQLKYSPNGATIGGDSDLDQARKYLELLMSTGLLGDDIATSLSRRRLDQEAEQLTEEQRRDINRGLAAGRRAARDLIECIPDEVLDSMLEDALVSGTLIGDRASDFFSKHLEARPEIREKANAVKEAYLADPLNYGEPQGVLLKERSSDALTSFSIDVGFPAS